MRRSKAWLSVVGRVLSVGVLGTLLGWGICKDVDWSAVASDHECADASTLCFGVAPFVGLAIGVIVAVAACWLGMAIAGLRPLILSVPLAVVALAMTTAQYDRVGQGRGLHPEWLFALVTGLVFVLLAACVISYEKWRSRPQRAGRLE